MAEALSGDKKIVVLHDSNISVCPEGRSRTGCDSGKTLCVIADEAHSSQAV